MVKLRKCIILLYDAVSSPWDRSIGLTVLSPWEHIIWMWTRKPMIIYTRREHVERKSSVCLILMCMKYRIIVLIIIIISLGKVLLSHIANTSRTRAHARAHTNARTHTHRVAAVQVSAIRCHPTGTAAGIHSRLQGH